MQRTSVEGRSSNAGPNIAPYFPHFTASNNYIGLSALRVKSVRVCMAKFAKRSLIEIVVDHGFALRILLYILA